MGSDGETDGRRLNDFHLCLLTREGRMRLAGDGCQVREGRRRRRRAGSVDVEGGWVVLAFSEEGGGFGVLPGLLVLHLRVPHAECRPVWHGRRMPPFHIVFLLLPWHVCLPFHLPTLRPSPRYVWVAAAVVGWSGGGFILPARSLALSFSSFFASQILV